MTGIYKITSPSNRIYIGQAINIKNRYRGYKTLNNCKSQKKLYRSFKKYGVEKHQFEIIEECLEEELNCRERYWQDFYDVLNGGLNCVLQECGEKRRIFSEEMKHNLRKNGSYRANKVIDIVTKQVYSSVREAAREIGCCRDMLKEQLNGKATPTTNIRYINDQGFKIYFRRNIKIVLDIEVGVYYYSLKEASDIMKIKYTTLKNMMQGLQKNTTNLVYV